MPNNNKQAVFRFALCAVAASMLLTSNVQAAWMSAAAGNGAVSGTQRCFQYSYGRVVNKCSGEPLLFVIAPPAHQGPRAFHAFGTGLVEGRAVVTGAHGWVVRQTERKTLVGRTYLGTLNQDYARGETPLLEFWIATTDARNRTNYVSRIEY
ncbi:MAG: hypothetical protein OXU20_13695 [Myxococcales bacterium]|nr:hypothetical protein [Myxococcales bacterium]MDD9969191.1 hypothetical protein [Myxococcales bacterium]